MCSDEGVLTRPGPRHDELATANRRLGLFAAQPSPQHSRFDMPPPSYQSSRGSTTFGSDPDPRQDQDAEERDRVIFALAVRAQKIYSRVPFPGMSPQERIERIDYEQSVKNNRLARLSAEHREVAQYYALRKSEPNLFGPNSKLQLGLQDNDKLVHIERTEDEPVLPAPKRTRGRPRTTVHHEGNRTSQHPATRTENPVQPEQRGGPRRSARIAARAAAAEKALPPASKPKTSRASKLSKRRRPRRGGR